MSKEIVSIQLGQCGNQVGLSYWSALCREHGLSPDGVVQSTPLGQHTSDMKDIFFSQVSDHKWVPRLVMADLEPRVIDQVLVGPHADLFRRDRVFKGSDGGGAGNVWTKGYWESATSGAGTDAPSDLAFEFLLGDMINREAEACDRLEGFMLTHSIGGGTGAGVGSRTLEWLVDNFPSKHIQTSSIFPQIRGSSDVVLAPYNVLLSLRRLAECADAVFVFDNSAFANSSHFRQSQLAGLAPKESFGVNNRFIARALALATAPMRLPSTPGGPGSASGGSAGLGGIIASLVPDSRLQFLTPSLSAWPRAVGDLPLAGAGGGDFDPALGGGMYPLSGRGAGPGTGGQTLRDMLPNLLRPDHRLAGAPGGPPGRLIAAWASISSGSAGGPGAAPSLEAHDVHHALARLRHRGLLVSTSHAPSSLPTTAQFLALGQQAATAAAAMSHDHLPAGGGFRRQAFSSPPPFAPWVPASLQIAVSGQPAAMPAATEPAPNQAPDGLLLSNWTGIAATFHEYCTAFSRMNTRRAYYRQYTAYLPSQSDADFHEELMQCYDAVRDLISEYSLAETADYLTATGAEDSPADLTAHQYQQRPPHQHHSDHPHSYLSHHNHLSGGRF
ncbi:hypothetical protein H696_01533 [Fonticula alba]|uniref:Tubulin/FtsZ GTPase domain-containing protein n=1 Tax=Fonticula alba TaxID=691883 RepID=A0A058ZF67_FONAL|nr:hypothetical protein H696_01533 [Fonticula alba]KCV72127.1 hypothetical protein H696_01533 [Fonticula alba]|eukprot:XP_009493705.1 hypothetical protein H696_01533 [Fonticula alba]